MRIIQVECCDRCPYFHVDFRPEKKFRGYTPVKRSGVHGSGRCVRTPLRTVANSKGDIPEWCPLTPVPEGPPRDAFGDVMYGEFADYGEPERSREEDQEAYEAGWWDCLSEMDLDLDIPVEKR